MESPPVQNGDEQLGPGHGWARGRHCIPLTGLKPCLLWHLRKRDSNLITLVYSTVYPFPKDAHLLVEKALRTWVGYSRLPQTPINEIPTNGI